MAIVSQKFSLYVFNHGVIKRTLEIEYRYTCKGYFSHAFKWNAQKKSFIININLDEEFVQ